MSPFASIKGWVKTEENVETGERRYVAALDYSDDDGQESSFRSKPFASYFEAEKFLEDVKPGIIRHFTEAGAEFDVEEYRTEVPN